MMNSPHSDLPPASAPAPATGPTLIIALLSLVGGLFALIFTIIRAAESSGPVSAWEVQITGAALAVVGPAVQVWRHRTAAVNAKAVMSALLVPALLLGALSTQGCVAREVRADRQMDLSIEIGPPCRAVVVMDGAIGWTGTAPRCVLPAWMVPPAPEVKP